MFLTFLIGFIIGLIILYMIHPYYKPYQLSSAHFFEPLLQGSNPNQRISLKTVIFSVPFWIQLSVFLCLIGGMLLASQGIANHKKADTVGILLSIDTSASMTTKYQEGIRFDAAITESQNLITHLDKLQVKHRDIKFCVSLLTFDSGGAQDIVNNVSLNQLRDFIDSLYPRLLGTNLNAIRVIRERINDPDTQTSHDCPITHMVVITDMPAPEWVSQDDAGIQVIWRQIAEPVNNVGINRITPVEQALFGWSGGIEIEVVVYGNPPPETIITIEDEEGTTVYQNSLYWSAPNSQLLRTEIDQSGFYNVSVTPGGDYLHDDQVTILIPQFEQIRYDWQLSTTPPPYLEALGWVPDTENPNIKIVPLDGIIGGIPTLIVGDYYSLGSGDEIKYFEDKTGILNNINLDAIEQLNIRGISSLESMPHELILSDTSKRVLIAANRNAPFVYIPVPPSINRDLVLDVVSQTLFFNAIRWLLNHTTMPELYKLTSNLEPVPIQNIVALHSGEGNTALSIIHHGELSDIQPVVTNLNDNPLWMLLAMIGVSILVIERLFALKGHRRWQ